MRIVFTGGGTGGHFYPIIAVVQGIEEVVKNEKLLDPELYFLSPTPYNQKLLFEHNVAYHYIAAGKWRRYFSIRNFIDFPKTIFGIFQALIKLYTIYPDVVFSKGGYASLPTVVAAHILRIPIIIHESDSKPGRVTRLTARFAQKIAVSYPQAGKEFNQEKVAHTGNPIRNELLHPVSSGAREYLKMEEDIPVLFILGGSQGAERINRTIVDALPHLVEKYYIIHQTGAEHYQEVLSLANVMLEGNEKAQRYKPYEYLDALAMRMAAGVADIVVTRAGSTLFEAAAWGVPSIIIPIPEEISHDQRSNAYAVAREGAGVVIEEANFSDDILISQVEELLSDKSRYNKMTHKAKEFAPRDAAVKIARELIHIGLSHE